MASKPVAPKVNFTDANANSFSDRLLRWELMEAKLAPMLDAMPHVKPVHDELVQLIANAKNLEFQVKGMKANLRQAVADRKAMVKNGEGIRSRLSSALSFEHGSTSVLLTEFGIRPRKPGGRSKKVSPPPTPPPQPQPETPAQTAAHGEGAGGPAAATTK